MTTKTFKLSKLTTASFGNPDVCYKCTADVVLLDNTGKTPIRVDKEMAQVSAYHSATNSAILFGSVVHSTDETGNAFTGSIVNGTTDLAALTALLEQWKDNIFMTDFQLIGTGADENVLYVSNLEADTRRILQPGQKLCVSIIAMPMSAETTKLAWGLLDNILWYSPAAQ